MGKGIFHISYELLKQSLYLPDDTEIISVGRGRGTPCEAFALEVEHPDIPEYEMQAGDGDKVPLLRPIIRKQLEFVFDGWGVDAHEPTEFVKSLISQLQPAEDM
jgi:hypothetical protein